MDIRLVQELLGHNSLKTTEIYTHITDKMENDVTSTLDYLDLSGLCVHLYEKYIQVCVYTIVIANGKTTLRTLTDDQNINKK